MMRRTTKDEEQDGVDFVVPVGSLSGVPAIHSSMSRRLLDYSEHYRNGRRPIVVLDLSNVQPKKMSMAAITAFLSISDRLRDFTDAPIRVHVLWNPEVFSFWDDIGVFKISDERSLFAWKDGIVGGYISGKGNPNTQILCFPNNLPPEQAFHADDIKHWKDSIRIDVKEKLLMQCGALFKSPKHGPPISIQLRDQVAVTCAELVVNAHLWGKSAAFVGLQRSKKGITVAVCDSGIGFYRSLFDKYESNKRAKPNSHLEALGIT